jgi:hypothetical protein
MLQTKDINFADPFSDPRVKGYNNALVMNQMGPTPYIKSYPQYGAFLQLNEVQKTQQELKKIQLQVSGIEQLQTAIDQAKNALSQADSPTEKSNTDKA